MKKRISLVLVLAFVLGLALTGMTVVSLNGLVFAAESPSTEAFRFVQLCDPQLGRGGYEHDVSSFKQAVRLINALKVDFVVICGDLIHTTRNINLWDDKSITDFKQIKAGLTVPSYCAPGDNDVGGAPTVASLNRYRQAIGDDYFSFEHKGYTFVIANSMLWTVTVQGESETHDSWFRQTLEAARDKNSPVFVVQHYPVSDLPLANELLALFETSGVVAVLSGHWHQLIINEYKGIQLVTGESTSVNVDGRPLGFRLWHVDSPTSITHEFIPLTLTIPTADFNGDGIVDSADMYIMVDHWGENYSLCDIGPTPLGDGIVDIQDLIVLAEQLFEDVNDPTLVAHWALDEIEGDIASDSANDNDGTVYGDPAWQPEGEMIDGALQLDGIDDYVSTPFVLNPADGKFSVFVWIKGGAPGQVVLSQMGGARWLCADPSGGNLITELKGTGRDSTTELLSQIIITDGNWHRIGLVWDGSNRTLYVDDVAVAEDAQANLEASENGLYIGAGSAMEAGTFWFGLIDDVRIYNRAVTP